MVSNVKKDLETSGSLGHADSGIIYPMCFHQLAKPNFFSIRRGEKGVGDCNACTYHPDNMLCDDYMPFTPFHSMINDKSVSDRYADIDC
jgi:hypothetical protein